MNLCALVTKIYKKIIKKRKNNKKITVMTTFDKLCDETMVSYRQREWI